MPTNAFVIVASFRATAEKADALEARLLQLVPLTRAEPGCVQYDLHRDLLDPQDFLFYEIWASRDAWDAHMATSHIADLKAEVGAYLDTPLRLWQMKQIEP